VGDSPAISGPGRVAELFAGVGGFALGLEGRLRGFSGDEGWQWELDGGPWRVAWANQWEPSSRRQHAAEGYRARFPQTPMVDADVDAALDLELAEEEGRDPRAALAGLVEHALDAQVPTRGDRSTRVRAAAALAGRWAESRMPERVDLLVGGFPCQDYSVAKTLKQASGIVGRKGVLWWQIERILRHRRPEHVILENVDRLLKSPTSERGRDFAIMLATFAFHGYEVEWRVINAAHYGLPQRRRRVFIYARLTETRQAGTAAFGPDAEEVLSRTGLFAESFPCDLGDGRCEDLLLQGDGVKDPKRLTDSWGRRSSSPWLTAGFMRSGEVFTAKVAAPTDDRAPRPVLNRAYTLGDMLLDARHVLKDPELHRFLVPKSQLDFDNVPAQRGTWNYLKGPKADPRVAAGGFSYSYSEGGIAFPEPPGRASRTIVTGEGGSSPSRFKLVVAQPVPDELLTGDLAGPVAAAVLGVGDERHIYRRLTPVELERLNMFPDGWTEPVGTATRRAFTMGNALVVGLVERLGDVLDQRIDAGL